MNVNEVPAAPKETVRDLIAKKRHLALWVAVGGIAVCVTAVWVLLLPLQLQKEKARGLSGWLFSEDASANATNLKDIWGETAQTFNQGIDDLRYQAKLGTDVETSQVSPTIVEKLRTRIEEAAAKKSAAPVNATTNSPSAPATPPVGGSAAK